MTNGIDLRLCPLQSGVAGVAAEKSLLASPIPEPSSLLDSLMETGLICLLVGLACLVGEMALFLFQASLGVSSMVEVGFFANIAGVTDSPNLAMGVGTDLIFSKRALRCESGMQDGSGDSAAGVELLSNMLRFWSTLLA